MSILWKRSNEKTKTALEMKTRTIFFDMGGVLINFSHEKMCSNIANYCGLDLDTVHENIFEKKLGEIYEKGEINSSELFNHFKQLSKKSLYFDELLFAISDIFSPKKETMQMLQQLKKQKIKLYLLSNTCEAHFMHIRDHYHFLQLFDGFVLSYMIKSRKPEKLIYDYALHLCKTPKEECFYVDDVTEYVEAAKKYGIDSHQYQNGETLIKALENRGIQLL